MVDGSLGQVRRHAEVSGPYIEVTGLRCTGRARSIAQSRKCVDAAMDRMVSEAGGRSVVVMCSRLHAWLWRREFSRRGWSCACLARLDLRSEGWTADEHVLRFEPGE